jgi:hypothetical protein
MDRDGYAIRTLILGPSRYTTVRMHRVILGIANGDPILVDHLNRNRRDNRRANLRRVTYVGNGQNRGPRTTSHSSKFRGVSYVAKSGNWIARVRLGSRLHNLGTYSDETQAGAVAAAFRAEHMPFAVEEVA